jgi:hypothetical protein
MPDAHAEPPPLAIGDPSDYVVLFFDFMGQREYLKQWEEMASQCSFDAQKQWQPRNPAGLVDAVQKSAFVIAELLDITRTELLGKLIYQKLNVPSDFQLKSIQFSDTIVFYGKMEAKGNVGNLGIFLINSAMLVASSVMFNSLRLKAPARGAITIGSAVEGLWRAGSAGMATVPSIIPQNVENFFYGPVFERAYDLENSIADYPRILVDWSVLNYLQCARQAVDKGLNLDNNYRTMMDDALGRLPGGIDADEQEGPHGFRVLDWAGKYFYNKTTQPCQRKLFAKQLHEALDFAKQVQTASASNHAQTGDLAQLKVAGKYARLVHYLEPRLALWTAD